MGCNACKGEEKETEENLARLDDPNPTKGPKKGPKKTVKSNRDVSKRDVSKRETRGPYSFENNAVYTGEWIGEERDGQGI